MRTAQTFRRAGSLLPALGAIVLAVTGVFAIAGAALSPQGAPSQHSPVRARSDEARLDLWEKQLILPPNVAARLDWARKSLVPSGLRKLERLALATAPAIASGTSFDTIRKDSELDHIFQNAGLSAPDVSEAAFIVMAMATKDMDDDIRIVMAEIKAMTAAKQKLRDQVQQVVNWINQEVAKDRERPETSEPKKAGAPGAKPRLSEKPRPPMSALVHGAFLEKASSPIIHLDYVKAPVVPPLPPQDSGTTIQGLKSLLDDLKGRLDGMNEMSEMTSLRLQMTMDRRSKFIQTLSNIMKKMGTTQDTLSQNLK
jgi:uncharacterized spore protein YtfJ